MEKNRLSIREAAADGNKSLQHRCEVQGEKGVKIERGLITVGGLGGLSELVDTAASDSNLCSYSALGFVPVCFRGEASTMTLY